MTIAPLQNACGLINSASQLESFAPDQAQMTVDKVSCADVGGIPRISRGDFTELGGTRDCLSPPTKTDPGPCPLKSYIKRASIMRA